MAGMKPYLFDTSVLIPAFVASHPHHARAHPWLARALNEELKLFLSAHSLAETFAVLTRLPLKPVMPPGVAYHLLEENLKCAEIVELSTAQYWRVLDRMRSLTLSGGSVYDAITIEVARHLDVECLLTFNVRDFRRLWPEEERRIIAP